MKSTEIVFTHQLLAWRVILSAILHLENSDLAHKCHTCAHFPSWIWNVLPLVKTFFFRLNFFWIFSVLIIEIGKCKILGFQNHFLFSYTQLWRILPPFFIYLQISLLLHERNINQSKKFNKWFENDNIRSRCNSRENSSKIKCRIRANWK